MFVGNFKMLKLFSAAKTVHKNISNNIRTDRLDKVWMDGVGNISSI